MTSANIGNDSRWTMTRLYNKFRALGEFADAKNGSDWLNQAMSLAYEAAINNKPATAEMIYKECVRIAIQELGPADVSTLEFRRAHANEVLKLKRFKDADDEYQAVVALAEQQLSNVEGEDKAVYRGIIEQIAQVRIELAKALVKNSDLETATTVNNDNYKICRRVLGVSHKYTTQAKAARTICRQQKKEEQEQVKSLTQLSETALSSNIATENKQRSKPEIPTVEVSQAPQEPSTESNVIRRASTGKKQRKEDQGHNPSISNSVQDQKALSTDRAKSPSRRTLSAGEAELRNTLPHSNATNPDDAANSPRLEVHKGSKARSVSPKPTKKHDATEEARSKDDQSKPAERDNVGHEPLDQKQNQRKNSEQSKKVPELKQPQADVGEKSMKAEREGKSISPKGDPQVAKRPQSTSKINESTKPDDENDSAQRSKDPVDSTENKRGRPLAKKNEPSHPSDHWLGERMKKCHGLFVRDNDDGFSATASKYKRRVRIAILDTGLDLEHRDVKKRIESKRIAAVESFVDDGKGPKFCEDNDGHGTHLTMLINKIAPKADIYVARVFRESWGSDERSVEKAINHAVKTWDVDIICMSFGFSWDPPTIWRAILNAALKNKLMFAAASNDGGNMKKPMYPANDPNVFCIHATNHDGDFASFNTKFSDADYSTLGISVKSAISTKVSVDAPDQTSKPKYDRRDGTSVAAAVAAGIAALILEFSRMPVLEGEYWSPLDQEELDMLHTIAGMRRVLDDICFTDPVTNKKKYLAPWQLITLDKCPNNKEKAISRCLKKLSTILSD